MSIYDNVNFITTFKESIKTNWDSIAVTEAKGDSFLYSTLANIIERNHLFWEKLGLRKGDKIAIAASNSFGWISTYMSIVTGGYVAVLLRPDMNIADVLCLLEHSDSILLYADEKVLNEIRNGKRPNVKSAVDIKTNQLFFSTETISRSSDSAVALFENRYPFGISKKDLYYEYRDSNDVCTIIYTSGTTGESKGVMLSVGSISENMTALYQFSCVEKSKTHINMIIPFFHVYGLVDELIAPLCLGKQLVLMRDLYSPFEICSVCKEFKPKYLLAIPILLQSIVEYVSNKAYNEIGFDGEEINALRRAIADSLGGEIEVIYSSGTACPEILETLLYDRLKLPLLVGYGMTECCTISLGDINHVKGSCGKIFNQTEIRIIRLNPKSLSGEIQVRGRNLFSGYYKNEKGTKAAFTEDGWFKTGDLGYIDEGGYLFITGRCKDMLLTSNGENIYPEEVEGAMDASPYIKESVLTQRGEKLHAIVVPDREKAEADGLDAEGLNKKIDEAVREASKQLPGFTIISGFELRDEPLERTPKGSLKRYLYSDGIKEN